MLLPHHISPRYHIVEGEFALTAPLYLDPKDKGIIQSPHPSFYSSASPKDCLILQHNTCTLHRSSY